LERRRKEGKVSNLFFIGLRMELETKVKILSISSVENGEPVKKHCRQS